MLDQLAFNRFREKYWLISLVVLIIGLGGIIFFSLWSYLSGILGACTLYVLVRGQLRWLTVKKNMGKKLAAALLLIEVTVFFLIPIVVVVFLLINKLQTMNFDLTFLIKEIDEYSRVIREKTGYDVLSVDNISQVSGFTATILQALLSGVTNLFINLTLLIFVLYFMLISHREMEKYIIDLLPFSDKNKRLMLHETRIIINSNAVGIPLLALIQGGFAFVGYSIFGVGEPFLYALFTCFATIIPIFGTAIVWVPLCLYLFLTKEWGNAIGLLLYAGLLITNVDNMARFILQKRLGDIHPLITVFGVIIGLYTFGFWGIIFGPLILSLFCLFIDMFKREYIDQSKQESVGSVLPEENSPGNASV